MHELRAGMLTSYLEVAESAGLDGYWMLRHAGIPPAALTDPETRVPAQSVVRLFEKSAQRSGCDNFGLLLAERRSFASLGPIALLLDRLGTVREMMHALIAFRRHMNDIITVDLEDDGETGLIRLGFMPDYAKVQVTDFAIALGYRVLTGASHGAWAPAAVHLTRPAPEDLTAWRRYFPMRIEFGSLFDGFTCASAALDIPNPHADPVMALHAQRLLQLVPLPAENAPIADRVRRSITLLLPNGQGRLEPVAAQMGLGVRALQRGLEQEGATFAGLLGEVRRELAQVYLGGAQSVTAISQQLGYASPSAFTRWFASEFGVSPQAWRNERRAQAAIPPPFWMV
ncbi:MAG: AraC family transcriptional regulator [Novosphingobium sp.]